MFTFRVSGFARNWRDAAPEHNYSDVSCFEQSVIGQCSIVRWPVRPSGKTASAGSMILVRLEVLWLRPRRLWRRAETSRRKVRHSLAGSQASACGRVESSFNEEGVYGGPSRFSNGQFITKGEVPCSRPSQSSWLSSGFWVLSVRTPWVDSFMPS